MIVNIRKTHRTLFWQAVTFALGSVAIGINFLFYTPPFNAYGIDVKIIGVIFIVLGAANLVALVLIKNLLLIRISMTACSFYMAWWGAGTAITVFQGKTSWQLPIAFLVIVVASTLLCWEPYINPKTANGNGR